MLDTNITTVEASAEKETKTSYKDNARYVFVPLKKLPGCVVLYEIEKHYYTLTKIFNLNTKNGREQYLATLKALEQSYEFTGRYEVIAHGFLVSDRISIQLLEEGKKPEKLSSFYMESEYDIKALIKLINNIFIERNLPYKFTYETSYDNTLLYRQFYIINAFHCSGYDDEKVITQYPLLWGNQIEEFATIIEKILNNERFDLYQLQGIKVESTVAKKPIKDSKSFTDNEDERRKIKRYEFYPDRRRGNPLGCL